MLDNHERASLLKRFQTVAADFRPADIESPERFAISQRCEAVIGDLGPRETQVSQPGYYREISERDVGDLVY